MEEVSSFLTLVQASAHQISINMGYLSVTFITSLIVYLTYFNIALIEAKDISAATVNENNVQKIPSMWLKAMPVRRFYKPAYPGEKL